MLRDLLHCRASITNIIASYFGPQHQSDVGVSNITGTCNDPSIKPAFAFSTASITLE